MNNPAPIRLLGLQELLGLLTIALIVLKLTHVIAWPWLLVALPFFLPFLMQLAFVLAVAGVSATTFAVVIVCVVLIGFGKAIWRRITTRRAR